MQVYVGLKMFAALASHWPVDCANFMPALEENDQYSANQWQPRNSLIVHCYLEVELKDLTRLTANVKVATVLGSISASPKHTEWNRWGCI
jgi:hypothetical protein